MKLRRASRASLRRPHPSYRRALAGVLGTALLVLTACGGDDGDKLAASADLPEEVPSGTVLTLGIPRAEVALEVSGLIDEVDGYEIEWANISGGPQSIQAFRAGALDASSVAEIPPLFATWTNVPVKVFAVQETVDPLENSTYQLGIAPGADVEDLDDLEGQRIAYSPGQAQGALVLKVLQEAGLSQDDVELIELQSVDDTFTNALASDQVDVAPLGGVQLASYLSQYSSDGAAAIPTGVRDDASVIYGPVETFEDPAKAAALRDFVELWVRAEQWIKDNPDEFIQAYYVDREGLNFEDGQALLESSGNKVVLGDWDEFIERHQDTADLLSSEQDQPEIDVEDLYDRRYEEVIADALTETEGTGRQ